MDLYYTLRALADYIYDVRSSLFSLGVKINGVYLLGQYLYSHISTLSAYVGYIGSRVADAADDWLKFRAEVMDKIGDNAGLAELIKYIDDILSIVRDPAWFIRSGIRQYFPVLADFDHDASSTIINIVTRGTGLTYSFIMSPATFIAGQITSALGELIAFRNYPRDFIINKLSQYVPELREVLTDPRGWLRREVQTLYAGLSDFLRDPESYIVDKMVSGVERLFNSYASRLAKIAENIINRMF